MARTRSLTNVAAFLSELASTFDLAAVVVNQMTTKVSGNESQLVPSLGESWAHATTTRLLLSSTEHFSIRQCSLVKSPHKASGTAFYDIRECGIRDVPYSAKENKVSNNSTEEINASKRQRC